jgi:acetyl-CoA/propionyl-CoA carboxylase biotin carboxyl carrier protein
VQSGSVTRLLVANRGEIAVRIMRAARELGIATVAIYGPGEERDRHVRMATDAWRLPGPRAGGPVVPYLDGDAIVDLARRSGADAIHPGYGFLSENAAFALACSEAGLTFVGPPAVVIAAMGDKVEARRTARAAGVPIVAGTDGPVESVADARDWADANGYPVAIKAAAGGGGRGFRVALTADQIETAWNESSGEAARFFNNPAVYLERYVPNPRHVEVQIFADHHGQVVSLGERDCSIQRRHQKLVEESPSPAVDTPLREAMGEAAISLARQTAYVGAGTVEFLLDGEGRFSFLEMNTRIQVEHPVTELVTGIDLVREQLLVARGERLSFNAADVALRGHAIECRINAEDPVRAFAPTPGTIGRYAEPGGFGVRVDSAAEDGMEILADYDSMIAKLIVWGRDRREAIDRMASALTEYELTGVTTTIPLHSRIMAEADFRAGRATTAYLPEHPDLTAGPAGNQMEMADARPDESVETILVEVDGRRLTVAIRDSPLTTARTGRSAGQPGASHQRRPARPLGKTGSGPELISTIQGTVVRVPVVVDQVVVAGEVAVVVSAMKMENEVTFGIDGRVGAIHVVAGQSVKVGTPLMTVSPLA